MNRVAAIDCGTNSLRLLIAEPGDSGELVEVSRRLEMVRLGQGVDAAGEFHPDALQRTFAAADRYAAEIAAAGVEPARIRFAATSAARDVRNREAFFVGIEARLGVSPEIIAGTEEARLSFAGAVSAVPDAAEPVLVIDIGGGSTELIVGERGRITGSISLDVGSVRLRERLLHSDPPSPAEIGEACRLVDGLLDGSGLDLARVRGWIGVAGTATTLAGIHLGLAAYDRTAVHGHRIPIAEVIELAGDIVATDVEALRSIPSMHPKRADVISAGALICERIARRVGASELIVSESDILDGLAMELLRLG